MRKLILAAAGITSLVSSVAALAGPDWTVIQKARDAKRAETHTEQMQEQMAGDHAAMMKACREMMLPK